MLDYTILATDGKIGHVSDNLLGDSDLLYHYLLIAIGGWLSGRTVLLSTAWLSSVEPEKRMIVVNIEKKRIQESPLYEPDADIRESPNIAGRRPGVLTRPGVSRARPGPGTAVVQREVAGAA